LRIERLRREYQGKGLRENDFDPNPIQQFEKWFQDAVDAEIDLPDAMTLATVTSDGRPSARMVLLRGFGEEGFRFYTDYDSPKGVDLCVNPQAALVFYWNQLDRQIRISGAVEKTSSEDSDAYFQGRPRDSQISAWASKQSKTIENRQLLEAAHKEFEEKFRDREVPRPPNWGGYLVRPEWIEFWQGRPNRLHDRLRYDLQAEGTWKITRISP